MSATVPPMRGFRLVVGIIALAWIALVVALLGGAVQTGMDWGDPVYVWTILAAIGAALGAVATYLLRRWGAVLYLLAAGSLLVQSWLVEFGGEYDFGWGYFALLVLFAVTVAINWKRMGSATWSKL